jgi:prephenate dehydratase
VPRSGLRGFRQVFEAVRDGSAAAGVVPLENLVSGSVREVYDLLLEFDLRIAREVVIPIDLCLAGLPGQRLADVERVYSHVQALGQAERFLRDRGWTLLSTYNTAEAGRMILDRREAGAAAVLSPRAAGVLGLEVLAVSVQDVPGNRTRFVVLAPPGGDAAASIAAPAAGGMPFRTTLAFAVRNEPGSLLRALEVFAERGINLSRLESRPSRSAAWEYVFWVDLDAAADEPSCADALAALRGRASMVRQLGSHPRAAEPGSRAAVRLRAAAP